MKDPVGAFDSIRDNFILYIKTAFGTRFPSIEVEREELLREPRVMCQEPWIEPLPTYQSSGKTVNDLDSQDMPGLTDREINEFKTLASCGLVGDYELHDHQVEMLKEVLSGKNCVVTAGTGSGKTEAFLLPLFAYLIRESSNWEPPGQPDPHVKDWWRDTSWQASCRNASKRLERTYRVPQRGNDHRDAAVRALIIYPMNALVEDQLTRLRKALDSDDARRWFEENRRGNRIYFGRYNSSAPVAGHEYNEHGNPNRIKIENLAKALKNIECNANAADQFAQENENEDVMFSFPRLNGAEMCSRWDMQDCPPDILITNFSMLSIMLMREVDTNIFEKTKQWLAGDENRVFHLIVDELHLYRGTAGAEVAYLIRLLLLRLGLTPDHPQLRILGSSASLNSDDPDSRHKSLKFLQDFFGASKDSMELIQGNQAPDREINGPLYLPEGPFVDICEISQDFPDDACQKVAFSLGYNGSNYGVTALKELIESKDLCLAARMLKACK